MLSAILKGIAGAGILFCILMLWIGVQHLFRKTEGLPPDCDVIGDTGRGCGHCGKKDTCEHIKK